MLQCNAVFEWQHRERLLEGAGQRQKEGQSYFEMEKVYLKDWNNGEGEKKKNVCRENPLSSA